MKQSKALDTLRRLGMEWDKEFLMSIIKTGSCIKADYIGYVNSYCNRHCYLMDVCSLHPTRVDKDYKKDRQKKATAVYLEKYGPEDLFDEVL